MNNRQDWLSPDEAVRLLTPKYGEGAKSVIVTRCRRGLLDAYATIVVSTYHNMFDQVWNGEYERYFDQEIPDTRQSEIILPPEFWSAAMADAPSILAGNQPPNGRVDYADWEIGDFGFKSNFTGSEGLQWQMCEAAGVLFNKAQIEMLLGPSSVATQETSARPATTRRTKYDWEAAIAAFAGAQQKLDIVPDLYAHGAQAVIEEWLATWLEQRGDSPAEATIRPKAKLILDAYKKADQEGGHA